MRVLFTSIRNSSHFQPLVPFIDACRRAGHDVAVAAPAELAAAAGKTGATFLPVAHPGDAALMPIWQRLRDTPPGQSNPIVIREIFAGALVTSSLPGMIAAIESFEPDVVVRESQEWAALLAADKLAVPHARVSITLQRMEARTFALAAEALDAHRRAQEIAADEGGVRGSSAPALTLFPAAFDAESGTAGRVFRFRAARDLATPLAPFGDAGQPLVYVSFGTVAGGMERARSVYRAALDAVAALPIRVLMTTGKELDPATLGALPRNVRVERFVPQDDVLPLASAAVIHGGSGTTLGALAAGVPLVVVPLFADQPDNAERVHVLGAGLVVDGAMATAATLRHALTRVLAEPAFRVAAQRIAADIGAMPRVDAAVGVLEAIARRAV